MVEELQGQGIEPLAGTDRVQEIGGDHGVAPDPFHLDSCPAQHLVVVLEVLADLPPRRVGQEGRELRQHPVGRQLRRRTGVAVADRDVERLVVLQLRDMPTISASRVLRLVVSRSTAKAGASRSSVEKPGKSGVIEHGPVRFALRASRCWSAPSSGW